MVFRVLRVLLLTTGRISLGLSIEPMNIFCGSNRKNRSSTATMTRSVENTLLTRDDGHPLWLGYRAGDFLDGMMQALPMDEFRARYLIAYALHLASEALKREENPPWNDINDMQALLDQDPQLAAVFRESEVIKTALKLGWVMPSGPLTEEIIREAREWTEWSTSNVVKFPNPESP
jgi:hypothetical protein